MDDVEKQRLLAEVRRASEESRNAKKIVQERAAARAAAIEAAIEAGIRRQEIADAAGTHRNLLYKITKRNNTP
ncbi:hypothetical protein [Corynebacterium sp. TAE3-ERU16]|uniref:hypothetical protein n=1 Tax=Corynebacterium sp. TAE3-ERU16 TaxID=2849493 RepID=UPI001C455931|nr:hypothetical protein [Corynebacterium sp. TAE3-ERU16]MBV7292378.1 hypothetical protein [Corynebacterium sp. TAE3-ERU16]